MIKVREHRVRRLNLSSIKTINDAVLSELVNMVRHCAHGCCIDTYRPAICSFQGPSTSTTSEVQDDLWRLLEGIYGYPPTAHFDELLVEYITAKNSPAVNNTEHVPFKKRRTSLWLYCCKRGDTVSRGQFAWRGPSTTRPPMKHQLCTVLTAFPHHHHCETLFSSKDCRKVNGGRLSLEEC